MNVVLFEVYLRLVGPPGEVIIVLRGHGVLLAKTTVARLIIEIYVIEAG